jgi:hypothetical protein
LVHRIFAAHNLSPCDFVVAGAIKDTFGVRPEALLVWNAHVTPAARTAWQPTITRELISIGIIGLFEYRSHLYLS